MDTKFPSHSDLHSQTLHMLASSETDQHADQVARDWQVGDVILNLYRVQAILGEGGMGRVYKVRHRGWGLHLAVKSPKPALLARTRGIERFEKECETWINLGLHPNVVSCYYVRRLGGIPRIFAEYVDGPDVYSWLKDDRAYAGPPEKILERLLLVAIQTAWGLHHAHSHGVVHRDVKPHNFLLTSEGTAKVTDFGLAEAIADAAERSETPMRGGMTPAFCSPEQAEHKGLDHRTDVWSWGLCVLSLFVGRVGWKQGPSAPDLLNAYVANPPRTGEIPPMPAELVDLLRHCFQVNPNDRPDSMLDLAARIIDIYPKVTGMSFPLVFPKPLDAAAPTLNNRAVSLMDLGKAEEAVKLWEEALRIEANLPQAVYNLGLVLWRAGRVSDDSLVRKIKSVRQNQRESSLPLYQLVQIHLERGACPEAVVVIRELRKLNGDRRDILEALERAKSLEPTARSLVKRVEQAHADAVKALCISPSANYALSASEDNTIRLWGLPEGDLVLEYTGHTGSVDALALTEDEKFVISAAQDRTIRVWDRPTAECLRVIDAPREASKAFTLLPGNRIFSRHGANTLAIWSIEKDEPLQIVHAHEDWINAVAASRDGRRGLSGGQDKQIKVWDLESMECIGVLTGHKGAVTALAIGDSGEYAISGGVDGTIRLWELATGRCIRLMRGHRDAIAALALSSDSQYALSGGLDSTVRYWHVPQGRCLRTFEHHDQPVMAVAMARDGRLALSGSKDCSINILDLGERRPRMIAPYMLCRAQRTESALSLESDFKRALQEGRDLLAKGQGAAAVKALRKARSVKGFQRNEDVMQEWTRLYVHLPREQLTSAWEHRQLKGHTAAVHSIRTSHDGGFVMSGSADGTVRLWELDAGRCVHVLAGHTAAVKSVSMHPDGRRAVSGGEDKTVVLWDLLEGRELHQFEGIAGSVESLDVSPDGAWLISGGWDLRMWDMNSGHRLHILEGHDADVVTVCWTPDGRELISGSSDQSIRVWNPVSGQCMRVLRGHTGIVRSLNVSRDGRFILSVGSSISGRPGKIRLWDRQSGEELRVLEGHEGPVNDVCLTFDGHYAFSASSDTSVRMWDLETGTCIRVLEEHDSPVTALTLTNDGKYLISGDSAGLIRIWLLDWTLADHPVSDWSEAMFPYVEHYLLARQPYAGTLSTDTIASAEEVTKALTKRGRPEWSNDDLPALQYILGCAGYGWVDPEMLAERTEAIASRMGRRTFFGLGRR